MSRKKASGLFWLVIIGIVIIAATFILRSEWMQRVLEIGPEMQVFIEMNDQTTGFVSLIETKTGDLSYLDVLATQLDFPGMEALEEEINKTADRIGISLVLYDEEGERIKTHGKRRLGDIMYVEIPVPGGQKSKIGLVTDVEIPDYIGFSGGKDGITGGGPTGG